jgi:hypothetical protein
MVNVYLFKSCLALFKTALSLALKNLKTSLMGVFYLDATFWEKQSTKADKKNPRFWGKPRIEIGDIYSCNKMETIYLRPSIGEESG